MCQLLQCYAGGIFVPMADALSSLCNTSPTCDYCICLPNRQSAHVRPPPRTPLPNKQE
ncbi:hypothetical protein XELAEV_18032042mg [Xenopus laevis]|uniref:Uncharacterized protein n=1 Tax=Xenopus laevis TaxID=8355 RepID=A0A974CNV7_XENLA|nr:hypothetical protein XELAEV_18032042mg [Xenopus laevis]